MDITRLARQIAHEHGAVLTDPFQQIHFGSTEAILLIPVDHWFAALLIGQLEMMRARPIEFAISCVSSVRERAYLGMPIATLISPAAV